MLRNKQGIGRPSTSTGNPSSVSTKVQLLSGRLPTLTSAQFSDMPRLAIDHQQDVLLTVYLEIFLFYRCGAEMPPLRN
jgi:hypothetical protein